MPSHHLKGAFAGRHAAAAHGGRARLDTHRSQREPPAASNGGAAAVARGALPDGSALHDHARIGALDKQGAPLLLRPCVPACQAHAEQSQSAGTVDAQHARRTAAVEHAGVFADEGHVPPREHQLVALECQRARGQHERERLARRSVREVGTQLGRIAHGRGTWIERWSHIAWVMIEVDGWAWG